ncbi:transposase, partial [archaeon]|nr:transposase [archaeon]
MATRRMFKFRIYPNKEQRINIDRTFDICRKTYNALREYKIETYNQTKKGLSKFDLNGCVKQLKIERNEMSGVHSQVLQNTSDRLTKAFNNMFFRIKRGEKAGFPRFKQKHKYHSFCYPDSGFNIKNKDTSKKKNKLLYLSKIGTMPIKQHRDFDDIKKKRKLISIKALTILKVPSGKYFASFSCVMKIKTEVKKLNLNNAIGLDVGLKTYITANNSESIANPRYYRKSQKRLAHLQRRTSRKKFLCGNWSKSKIKVARLHERTANQRMDFSHKLTTEITNKYSFIGVESLNIKGMVRNHNLSKSILDAGWGMSISQLHYKVSNTGGVVQKIDRFYPSSKTCSKCGHIQDMPLEKRTYNCGGCGFSIDRDLNASINIKNEALRTYLDTVGI